VGSDDGQEKSHLIRFRLDRKRFLLFFLPCSLTANLENSVETPERMVTMMAMRIHSQELELEVVL
jgi:hypothetical protein